MADYQRTCTGHIIDNEKQWEQTRLIYSILYNVNVKKNKKRRPDQLIPLGIDKKAGKIKRMSEDRFILLTNKWERIYKKNEA